MQKKVFTKNLGLSLGLLFFSWIGFAEEMSLEDRVFDLEAQVSTLNKELESTKKLASQEQASVFNPSISVVGDLIGQYGIGVGESEHEHDHDHGADDHSHAFQNGVMVREIEFEFRAEVDPWASGLVTVALEPSLSDVHVHLEEAFVELKRWPGMSSAPLGIRTKLGKFRATIGRMNRIHPHHTQQINFPTAMKRFLGGEGLYSKGLSFNLGFPFSRTSALNIFLEGSMGSNLPMQKKGAEEIPLGIGHAWYHHEISSNHFIDIGTSGVFGRKGAKGSGLFNLIAADFHYSYLPPGYGQNPFFLLGNEFYTANVADHDHRWPMGNFTWAQVKIIGPTFLGVRYEFYPQEEHLEEFEHTIASYFSYYTTEFLRFRLGYEHVMPHMNSFEGDHRMMASVVFIMGSHPIEPYFMNR